MCYQAALNGLETLFQIEDAAQVFQDCGDVHRLEALSSSPNQQVAGLARKLSFYCLRTCGFL